MLLVPTGSLGANRYKRNGILWDLIYVVPWSTRPQDSIETRLKTAR